MDFDSSTFVLDYWALHGTIPNMPKRPTLKPTRVPGREKPWKIDLSASISSTGQRARYFFESKQDAMNFAEDHKIRLKNFGTQGTGLATPSELEQLAQAKEALKPFGASINQAVQDWVTRRRAAEQTVTFTEAFRQFETYLGSKRIKGRPVSKSYRRQVKYTFPRFPTLHDKPLTEIDDNAIEGATDGMRPSVKNSFLRVLSALFSWSAKAPRKWVRDNPTRHIEKESVGGNEIETFTPDETARILDACVRTNEGLLPYHLLGFFAGIRPKELERTRWEFIDLDEDAIVLPAQITKTGKKRVVELSDTLADWLRWMAARHGIQQGPIVSPVNLCRRLRAVRAAAGVKWIQDGMRHTYASCWLAIYKNEHRLRDNLGHRSADELWDHYHKAVTARIARKFWEILPPEETKVVAFQREGAA